MIAEFQDKDIECLSLSDIIMSGLDIDRELETTRDGKSVGQIVPTTILRNLPLFFMTTKGNA